MSTHNLCFRTEIRTENGVNPSFIIFNGIRETQSKLHGHVSMMFFKQFSSLDIVSPERNALS